MEERTVLRKNREIQRRKRRGRQIRRRITGTVLSLLLGYILFFAILLTGASRSVSPMAAPTNFAAARHRPVSTDETIRPEKMPPDDRPANTETVKPDAPWYLTLVNRWNPIPDHYEVRLVEVAGGEQVDERIYEPLMEMLEAAREDNLGQLPIVVSGYRTQEKQQRLYEEKIAEYRSQGYSENEAKEMAKQWVAVPGFSEHQLGFAVDINGAAYDIYQWLQENSYRYGFIFRYPGSKTDITGTAEEVWHYRYVGVEAAAEIYEQGICLEEYLEGI